MSDITTQKLEDLQILFSEQDLPDVIFKSSLVDVAQAVNTLGDLVELKVLPDHPEAEHDRIVHQVLKQYDALKSCPQHHAIFAMLNKVASSLGENIASVFQILQTSVHPEVEALHERVMEKVNLVFQENKDSMPLLRDPSENMTFDTVSFTSIIDSFGGLNEVLQTIRDMTGYDPSLSLTDLATIVNIVQPQIDDLSIHEETKSDILRRVKEKFDGKEADSDIEKMFLLLTDSYEFKTFVKKYLVNPTEGNDHAAMLQANIAAYMINMPMVEVFQSTPFNISDDLMDRLHANISRMQSVMHLLKYSICIFAQMFQNVLILSETLVNQDMLMKFYEQGGKKEDILRFIYIFYVSKNILVPSSGISMEEVQQEIPRVTEEFVKFQTTQQMNFASIRRDTFVTSLKDTLMEYLASVEESRLPEGMSLEMFVESKKYLVSQCANTLAVHDETYLENALFTFIIELWYDNTIIRTAHELFGTETLRQLEVSTELSEDQLRLVDARVAAALAAKFVVSQFCTKK